MCKTLGIIFGCFLCGIMSKQYLIEYIGDIWKSGNIIFAVVDLFLMFFSLSGLYNFFIIYHSVNISVNIAVLNAYKYFMSLGLCVDRLFHIVCYLCDKFITSDNDNNNDNNSTNGSTEDAFDFATMLVVISFSIMFLVLSVLFRQFNNRWIIYGICVLYAYGTFGLYHIYKGNNFSEKVMDWSLHLFVFLFIALPISYSQLLLYPLKNYMIESRYETLKWYIADVRLFFFDLLMSGLSSTVTAENSTWIHNRIPIALDFDPNFSLD